MRNRIAIIILLLLICAPLYAKDEKAKIGYVDLYKVFSEYQKTRDSEEALEKKAVVKNKERDKMAEEIRKLQDEAELLNEKEREKKEALIEDKLKALRDFDRATREELNRERDSKGRDILIEIGKHISSYGEKKSFDLILDSRSLFYGGESTDLTNDIIKEMNSRR